MTTGGKNVNNFQKSYLRIYDIVIYLTQAGLGYLKVKFVPARFGRFPVLRGKVKFHVRGEAAFGERFTVLGSPLPVRISVERGGRLMVGDHVAVNCGVVIDAWHDVRIGNKVMIAPNVTILDDNRHEIEPGAPLCHGPTVIEDNVWLAGNVTVLPGVTIGAGSVIAGHSVVSRDIPPNSFAGGTPAKVIKSLNIPNGWSHRFGYECNEPASGFYASLRRTIMGDPNAAIAQAVPTHGEHHEVMKK